MRQPHVAGDKLFVDFSGKKIGITDPVTGAIRLAEIFVAVLGASNYTYAEATWTQGLSDWIGAHVRMFGFYGSVPRLLGPDNLKAGVHKPSFYDPEVNHTYGRMAEHYSIGILPARPYRPKDKAKVEAGVRFAQAYILGRLRQLTFFSLEECNQAIAGVLEHLNGRIMRRLGVSRRDLFVQIEQPALRPLPALPYEAALRIRGMETRPGRPRLPCRGPRRLLLGAAQPDPRGGRGPHHRAHHRAVSLRPARRHPCPLP